MNDREDTTLTRPHSPAGLLKYVRYGQPIRASSRILEPNWMPWKILRALLQEVKKVAVSFQYVCYLQLHFHSASTLVYLQRIHLVTLTEKWLVKDFRHWPRVPLLLVSTYLGIMAGECIVHPFVFHLLLFECINCKIIIIIKCETRAKFLDNVVICPRGNACRVWLYRHFNWRRQRLL